MATVYLAHDLKHDCKVAIKVLRPELAAVLSHPGWGKRSTAATQPAARSASKCSAAAPRIATCSSSETSIVSDSREFA